MDKDSFLNFEQWDLPSYKDSPLKYYLMRSAQVFLSSLKDFASDNCYLRASALTFYSLLSIVPVLAVAFGIAKGFGFDETLREEISATFSEQPQVADKLIEFSYSMLEHARGGVIAGIGVIALFYTVYSLLNNIESSLNHIWNLKTARSYLRKFTDYLAMMLILPIFFIVSSSLTVYISTQITETVKHIDAFGPFTDAILFMLNVFPFILSWVLFSFIYLFMPNTKVNFWAGAIAGIIGGTVFQIWQKIYITFQIGVSSYGAIYGSFAALPLFLIWLHFSWLIVLFGAEIAARLDREGFFIYTPEKAKGLKKVSQKEIALLILLTCIEAYKKGENPPSASKISNATRLPLHLVKQTLGVLVEADILSEVTGKDEKIGYQMRKNPEYFDIVEIETVLDSHVYSDYVVANTAEIQNVSKFCKELKEMERNSEANINLKELSEKI